MILKTINKQFKNVLSDFRYRKCRSFYFECKILLEILTAKTKRAFFRPALPVNANGEIYLHLGCGDIVEPGFINIDGIPRLHVHYVRPLDNLQIFKDGTVDFIFASHCLEHFSHEDVLYVLREWLRVLKPGGKLCLSVPDFDVIIQMYAESNHDIDSILCPLMGGQEYKFNYHKTVFNYKKISTLLTKSGFSLVYKWTPDSDKLHSIDGWCKRDLQIHNKSYPISLNVEAVK